MAKWALSVEQQKAVWDYIDAHDWTNRRNDEVWYSDGVFKNEWCGEAAAEALGFTTDAEIADCIHIASLYENHE